ncbi:MAG: DUF1638 domain-containing protein [Acidimicrobiales bacterium]|jgi:hypothetical protein
MRIRAITCEVLARTVYLQAALAPHVVDVELLEQALHDDRPASRLSRLQSQIDATSATKYQAVALVYGLCNLALEGLLARDLPVAVARAHDCITLYLGSRQRYDAEFTATPGTYYYSDDYMERQAEVGANGRRVTMGVLTAMEQDYDYLVAKYGEDNAQYLMEVFGQWHSHYTRAAYIETGLGKSGQFSKQATDDAEQYGWRFEQLRGDPELVRKLLAGEWDDDFLVLQPGQRIAVTHDSRIIEAV